MGIDKFTNFISKSINNSIEEINIDDNYKKIISNHVIFDLNFLIYQEIINIENEINDIIKVILCLPFSLDKSDILETIIKNIFTQKHWKQYYINSELENLFDGFNEDEIICKFINYITNYKINSISIIEYVIYEKIINKLTEYIEKIHLVNFIQSLSLFCDGIPSFSKILEQRRRRIKHYLETTERKKILDSYFENMIPNNKNLFDHINKEFIKDIDNTTILFDYFKWIKYRYNIDKSFGTSSNFIKNLELFINKKIKEIFINFKIYINGGSNNGESDLKIFKYIIDNDITGDICIHTTDSDLIYQILIQQTYNKIINKDINYSLVKYLRNNNSIIQIFDSNNIIKNIMNTYNIINNVKTNNYKIIWDICLIFYLFGNDHIPPSFEIGPELGLNFYLINHYKSLNKKNIINLKKTHININLNNFCLFLEKINETNTNNITKIILQRYFKINYNLIILLVDKLNLNFDNILLFLKIFIKNIGLSMDKELYELLDDTDLRKVFVLEDTILNYTDIGINNIELIEENIKLIEENIDYTENEFNGLILYNKPYNITTDTYEDLYNYINDISITNISKKYKHYNDYINIYDFLNNIKTINENTSCNEYLKKIYHLTLTQYGNMKYYYNDNITCYKHYNVPSINNLITFIKNVPDNQIKIWYEEILSENIEHSLYLNPTTHYILITPYINNNILEYNDENVIENLWMNNSEHFDYRNIDIIKFLSMYITQ
jgi:hypothetical protein